MPKDSVVVSDSLEIRVSHYFSLNHLYSAAFFCRNAYCIEESQKDTLFKNGKFDENILFEHRAYVSSAIILSVAFLEATVNELIHDISDDETRSLKYRGNSSPFIQNLANVSELSSMIRNVRETLEKYNKMLELAQFSPFVRGSRPYQQASDVIKLRNELVHYKLVPQLAGANKVPIQSAHFIEKMMRKKFPENPLTGKGNPYFPDKCLGHGCAEWTVKSTMQFTDAFYSKIKMTPHYDHIRDRIQTRGA